ncbi:unnamed protein product, partial [Brenthis ino]
MMILITLTASLIIQAYIHEESLFTFASSNSAPNFIELAARNGFEAEKHDVVTEDGYILGLFHIRGNRGLPIFLMHALTDTSDTWLLRGNTSLGATLSRLGYDIWFGNVRGNRYSRRHITLNPDRDPTFWNFSFHEHGYYDLPAIINTILKKTGAPKLNAIGHSQGNTVFYVLGSTKPEYNDKVNILIALAPICYLDHMPLPLSALIEISPIINAKAIALGETEIFGDVSTTGKLNNLICRQFVFRYEVCTLGVLFPLFGYDIQEFGPKYNDIVSKHFPSSTTRMNLYHFAQVALRHRFARYDFGPDINIRVYNSTIPPNYDLKKVTMPVVLVVGKNDKVSTLADVATLRAKLPNVKKYILIEMECMNHLDFVWGEHMADYLFPHILSILEGCD